MKIWLAFWDLFFLIRPILLFPVWSCFLAGYWSGIYHSKSLLPSVLLLDFIVTILALTLVMGSVYVFNQICDIQTDKINGKLFLLSEGKVSKKSAYFFAALLLFLGILLSGFISIHLLLILLFLFLLSGWLYNYPPVVWKNHPIGGLLVNGVGGLVIFCIGWEITGNTAVPFQALCYLFAGMAVFINTTFPDIKGDRAAGKITFVIRYGAKVSCYYSLIFELAAVGLAYYFEEWILFFPGLVSLPFFVLLAMTRKEKNIVLATKISVTLVLLAVSIKFPFFVVPVLIVSLITRWYYKMRFQLVYPSYQ